MHSEDQGKVVSIEGAQQAADEKKSKRAGSRKEKTEKQGGSEKQASDELTFKALARQIVELMNHSPLAMRGVERFPHKFHVIRDDKGRPAYLEEHGDRLVSYVVEERVSQAVLQYCHRYLVQKLPEAQILPKQAQIITHMWRDLTNALPFDPDPFAELSAPGLAFARLPFDVDVGDTTAPDAMPPAPPIFGEFLTRCDKPEELAAFIGSLLYPDADRQQYLYLQGEGSDGKGALFRFLHLLLGDTCQALQPKEQGDRFWNAKVYGKRLVLFAECDKPNYFSSPEFKSLTGNDPIYIEEKGRMGFTAIPNCKIMVGSNVPPRITGQHSDLRRLIYIRVSQLRADTEVDTAIEHKMTVEAKAIMTHCKWMYLYLTKFEARQRHSPIPHVVHLDVIDESEEHFVSIFEDNFAPDDRGEVKASELREVIRDYGVSDRDIHRLKECWKRRFGIGYEARKLARVYTGLRKLPYRGAKILEG